MKEIKELEDIRKHADFEIEELERALKLVKVMRYAALDVISNLKSLPCKYEGDLPIILKDLEKYLKILERYAKKSFKEEKSAFKLEKVIVRLVDRAKRDISYYESKFETY